MKLMVEQMRCGECVRTIVGAVLKLDLGARVNVDLTAKHVRIEGRLTVSDAAFAIEHYGFKVASIVDGSVADTAFRIAPGRDLAF